MLRIAVTGANGFVGHHLIRELHSRGHEVIGIGHGGQLDDRVAPLVSAYYECDLSDASKVAQLPLQNLDAVINLAGLAKVGQSFDNAEVYKKMNVALLHNIGERLLQIRSTARLIAVSTGAVYDPSQAMPLSEDSAVVTDGSPYAISKLMMENSARQLRQKGLDCIIARPFNHAGPGQAPGFIIPDLYAKIIAATDGRIQTGDLATKRDYTDVRDVVRAYIDLAAAETLEFDLYNICSSQSRSGQEILELLLKELSMSRKISTETDKSLIRPNDPDNLYGSYDRIREETGWEPEIFLEQTISDFVAAATSAGILSTL